MRCFVTGATGHVGNVLVKELYKKGYEVTSLVLPKDNYEIIEPYSEILIGNVLDYEFLKENIKDYDFVFHLAGIVEIGTGNRKKVYKVNVIGTKNVLQACQVNKIPRLIYTSSVHAIKELPKGETMSEPEEFNPEWVKGHYAKSKAIASNMILNQKDKNLETVIVYPTGIIGPFDYKLSNVSQVFVDFLMGRLKAYLKGGYNFVDVRDVVNGLILAAEKGKDKEGYILSGSEITVKELLDVIAENTGRKPVKTKLAFWFILAMSYFAEVYYKILKQKPLFTHYSIVVLNSNYSFSNEKARKELGYEVRDLNESIKDTIAFSIENYLERKGKKYKRKSFE
jgi:dihydroflavonol-4-reductase